VTLSREFFSAGPQRTLQRYKACRTLGLARAACAALHAEEIMARRRVEEEELVLGLLRDKVEEIHSRLEAADRQLGAVRAMLDSKGITTISLSDGEDGPSDANRSPSSPRCPPSDSLCSSEILAELDHTTEISDEDSE